MKKFEKVAMTKQNEKWNNSVKRQQKLYSHEYGLSTMRNEFDRDYTRILNCNAYRRLKHKTQVFFSPNNDHICTRLEHVNLVESVSYTIANFLGLNTELTRAISIAHDLGHSPFGHKGEKILSEISEREYGEKFWHEKNGLHFVDDIELLDDNENKKRNLYLTYATRDGIISHCGEVDENAIRPRDEYINLEKEYLIPNQFQPYTWEGCVVKISDKIAYIGRDIEDAISRKLLTNDELEELNEQIKKITLNNTNIINYLTVDLCKNSSPESGLKFSKNAVDAMNKIKEFNYKKIYENDKIGPTIRYFKVVLNEIFYTLKKEFDGKNTVNNLKKMARYYPVLSKEFIEFISRYAITEERDLNSYENKILYDLENLEDYCRLIVDYISGMSDQYIVQVYNEIVSF